MEIKAVRLITQEELLKLAKLSCIKLEPHEVEPLRESLDAVLGYASRLKDVAEKYPDITAQQKLSNVFRPDVATLCTEPIVECAQAHENNYFVVPVIIKQS
jgi:aspartyl/glutamyl-tRNA(Asn/Gln) amidotransferase C subunit